MKYMKYFGLVLIIIVIAIFKKKKVEHYEGIDTSGQDKQTTTSTTTTPKQTTIGALDKSLREISIGTPVLLPPTTTPPKQTTTTSTTTTPKQPITTTQAPLPLEAQQLNVLSTKLESQLQELQNAQNKSNVNHSELDSKIDNLQQIINETKTLANSINKTTDIPPTVYTNESNQNNSQYYSHTNLDQTLNKLLQEQQELYNTLIKKNKGKQCSSSTDNKQKIRRKRSSDDRYILKSAIPSCPAPIDMNNYVLKSSILPSSDNPSTSTDSSNTVDSLTKEDPLTKLQDQDDGITIG